MISRIFICFCIIIPAILCAQEYPAGKELEVDSNHYYIVSEITISGNKQTKSHIIRREMLFAIGDTILARDLDAKIVSSRNNLLNTSLFNFVTIRKEIIDKHQLEISVNVEERWYWWPFPIFEIADRNFNTWWKNRDYDRVNYGLFLARENFRGRNESVQLQLQFGFEEKLGLGYRIPYLTKKQNSGIGFAVSFSRNNEITYSSLNNELLWFEDENNTIREEFSAELSFSYRQGLYKRHMAYLEFQNNMISDTIVELNPDYFLGGKQTQQFLKLHYKFSLDRRDSRLYPLRGYYFDVEFFKYGFGLFAEDVNVLFTKLWFRRYWRLTKKTFLAANFRAKLSALDDQPYNLMQGLGYKDYVRGYELYVMDGQHYWLSRAAMNFVLVPTRVQKLGFVPLEKFNKLHYTLYLSVFSDAGYAIDEQNINPNPLTNKFLFGSGVGLHWVTYYDLLFRMEYSINKLGEHGFFVHMTTPI